MRVAVEADAIISLPKLKTHGLVQFTGATKNLFGTVPGVIKASYHARFAAVERFSAMLIDVLSYHNPVLTIMDAVVGMEGDGPSGGDPRHIGLLLTSTDGVALDVVASTLVGMAPLSVAPIAAAVRRGLISGQVEDIEVQGHSLDAARVVGFKRPRTGVQRVRMIPSSVPSWITDQLLASPQASSKCTACGVCVENCPVEAITIVDGRARMDLHRCIRCYCCHELCPEDAVELKQSLLARLLNR
jgi:ferredoxin